MAIDINKIVNSFNQKTINYYKIETSISARTRGSIVTSPSLLPEEMKDTYKRLAQEFAGHFFWPEVKQLAPGQFQFVFVVSFNNTALWQVISLHE